VPGKLNEYQRARTWVTMAPMKNRMTPTAAAIPIGGTAMPTSSPTAPAALRTPSGVSHDSGTPALTMFARTL